MRIEHWSIKQGHIRRFAGALDTKLLEPKQEGADGQP